MRRKSDCRAQYILRVVLSLLPLCPIASQALRSHAWLHANTAAAYPPASERDAAEPLRGHITHHKQQPTSRQKPQPVLTEYGCPKDALFDDPWVKQNVVLTYAGKTRDGLGSQALRMMGVYAAAATLGLQYVHTPLHCIGHFGLITYRNSSCDDVDLATQAKMSRMAHFVSLPNMSTAAADFREWDRDTISGNWTVLAQKAQRALELRQPTIIQLEGAHVLAWSCPGMFNHVQAWRRVELSSSSSSSSSSTGNNREGTNGDISSSNRVEAAHDAHVTGQHHWLLDRSKVVRIAVHHRRGDVAAVAQHSFRYLPVAYYLNIVKGVSKVLGAAGIDYTVEWFTEASATPAQHEDMAQVRKEVPNLTLVFDSDIIWTWDHMATADVLVMSLSAFSIVPAIVNQNGVIIRAPSAPIPCAANTASSQWLEPHRDGTLTSEIVGQLSARFLHASASSAAQPASAQHSSNI